MLVTEDQKCRFATAIDRVAGDVSLLVSIATIVTEDAPIVFAKFKDQLAAGDLNEVSISGHQLKGMLSTFETAGPVSMLQQVLVAARQGNRREAEQAFRRCDKGIDSLIDEIRLLSVS